MTRIDEFTAKRSDDLFMRGIVAVEIGDYVTALNEFRASCYVQRSADALTHWGWMEHNLGDTDKAIDLCKDAIGIDPDYGNPYNDIGSYLVSLGRTDEAIVWFGLSLIHI